MQSALYYMRHFESAHESGIYPHAKYKTVIESDLTCISGIGPAKEKRLQDQGIFTLKDVMKKLHRDSKIAKQASALVKKTPVFESQCKKMPPADELLFLDIESVGPHMGVFMIGIIEGRTGEYTALVDNSERRLAAKFKKHMRGVSGQIWHWSNYDATNMKRMGCAHTDTMHDMLKFVKDNCCLPLTTYSIKDVSAYCGFDGYERTDITGMDCGILWNLYMSSKDQSILEEIEKYNRTDCQAMISVLDWFNSKVK